MKKCLIVSTVSRQFTLFERGNIEVLKELGYEVHCAANFSDSTHEIKELNIVNHNIDIQRSPFSLKNIKAYKQLKQLIDSEDYRLIHCHSPMGGVLTRLAARKKRKRRCLKVIYTAHGFHFYKEAPIINWMLYYPIEKWMSKYTDCLITINEEDYKIAKERFKSKKIQLINGIGVDESKYKYIIDENNKKRLKKDLNIKEKDFIIIQIGELNKNKNQIMAIKAMRKIVLNDKNVHLLIVGKGKMLNQYERIIKKYKLNNNVHLLGFRNDISDLLKISNILLSLSFREGLPVNVIEGMMTNIPIIATNCRGNRDLIENGKNGYIIDKKIDELIERIEFLKNNKITVFNNDIIEKYTKKNIKNKMKRIYQEI